MSRRSTGFVAGSLLVLGAVLRLLWPLADPASRFSWSNGIYSDPPTLAHAARSAVLFHEWITDYNRDLFIYPLMNGLTWIAYQLASPGRLPTVVLAALAGVATVAAVVVGLWRSVGPRAAVFGALLGALDFWLVMFSRIPVAENVVVALLAWSAVFALSNRAGGQALAGAIGVGAVLFGKYHAVGYLPALLVFMIVRHRSVRGVLPTILGGTLVCLVWVAVIFLPERETVLAHVAAQSTGLHGRLPIQVSPREGLLEPFNTLRRSWMFYRMPIIASLGSLFALGTVGFRGMRRRSLVDGTAIYGFWLVSMWAYLSLLAYKAPRYYVLIGAPLVAGAAVMLDRWFARGVPVRRPKGATEIAALALWAFAFCFGAIDSVKHYASIALEYLTLPPPRISTDAYDFLYDLFHHVDTFYQNLAWAGVFAAIGFAALYGITRVRRNSKRGRGVSVALLTVSVVVALAQYAWYATHRTRYLEEVKESLPAMLADHPVLLGPMAPLIAQNTTWPAHPYYGPPGHPEVLAKYGITHVVICGPGEARQFEERFPGLLDETVLVQSWPVQTLFSSSLEVRRLPARGNPLIRNEYRESAFERGSEAVAAEHWQDALDRFAEFRAAGGAELPELLSLESVCWFKLGELGRAESLLKGAIERRPRDPLNYQNLAVLDLRRGDRASALEHLMVAIRIDPHSPQLEQMIQELTR